MKLLSTADLHLGRQPSRLPSRYDGDAALGVAGVWGAIVDTAIEQGVAAVLLSGDLIDKNNRLFEAWGPLQRGLTRLAQAGIETLAVAGNHDFNVLPDFFSALGLDRCRLLGAGGQWETRTLTLQGRAVRFVGWSFPQAEVRHDPLDHWPSLPEAPDTPTLALVHGDLDQPASRYAPLSLSRLRRQRDVDAWLLGHIHAPALYGEAVSGSVLYPGSPQPLDPGERGQHGPWLIELLPHQPPRFTPLPLASLRYEALEIDITGIADADALRNHLPDAVLAQLRAALGGAGEASALRYVSARLQLNGRSALHRGEVDKVLTELVGDLDATLGQTNVGIEKALVATRPAVDLDALATGSDAPAALARLLLALEGGELTREHHELLRQADQSLGNVRRAGAYQPILSSNSEDDADDALDDRSLHRRLLRQGQALLNELVAQKGGTP